MKDLKDLNLLDRFLFAEAMEDPQNMRDVLALIAVWKNRRKKISDKRKGTAEITRELSVSFTKVLHFLAQK